MALVPKNLLSFLVGKLVALELPRPLALASVRWFAKQFKIDLEEAELPIEEYKSINHFFTRKLKPGIRPLGEGFVHPCDGRLTRGGPIAGTTLIQAKGKTYDLKSLFANQGNWQEYQSGSYLTYYLCPTDYHRVHSPMDGKITSCLHIPGRLWPVNSWSVENINQLFSVNERVVITIQTEKGPLALIMVGATNVGKMTMAFDPKIVTNAKHWRNILNKEYTPPITIHKGQELGTFNMGSTVVIVTPKGFFDGQPAVRDKLVRLGSSLEIKEY